MDGYTIVAIFKDGSRYEVARYIPDDELDIVLDKLRRKHLYRYARFEFFTEDDE
jgi:hypothetical protein